MPRAQFKVQDLLVDVVAPNLERLGQFCLFPTKYCKFLTLDCPQNTFILCVWGNTYDPCRLDASLIPCGGGLTDGGGCGANYSTCWQSELFLLDIEKLLINPAEIDQVREQVNTLLEAVSSRAKEVQQDMQPKTLAQAELLEQELQEALEEVQQLKERLG